MTWFLFLLVNVTLFLRPGEIIPGLELLPIYEVVMIACCIGALPRIREQVRSRVLHREPISFCVMGLLVAAVLSHLSLGNFGQMIDAGVTLLKSVVYYLILMGLVTTPQRLRQLLLTVAISISTMVTVCVLDYYEVIDLATITHLGDWADERTATGEVGRIVRLRGPGIFNDPNDISVMMVLAGVLCTYFLTDARMGAARGLWLAPLCALGTGLLCTQSRGGLLSAGAAWLILPLLRYGKSAAIVAAVFGAAAMAMLGGRQGNIGLGEGTGQDRVQLWAEGFAAIVSPKVIFGIGMNEYAPLAGLVAHNSFVHAYVELGLFGGTFFFGCFFFAAWSLYRILHAAPSETKSLDPELKRFAPFLASIVTALGVGMLSLSRCYVVPTYLVFGLTAAYVRMVGCRLPARRPILVWNRQNAMRLVTCSSVLLMGLFVATRILVRWS